MCLRREDVVLHVKRQILGVGKEQEEILEHLGEEEGVHSARAGKKSGRVRAEMRWTVVQGDK